MIFCGNIFRFSWSGRGRERKSDLPITWVFREAPFQFTCGYCGLKHCFPFTPNLLISDCSPIYLPSRMMLLPLVSRWWRYWELAYWKALTSSLDQSIHKEFALSCWSLIIRKRSLRACLWRVYLISCHFCLLLCLLAAWGELSLCGDLKNAGARFTFRRYGSDKISDNESAKTRLTQDVQGTTK